MDKKSSVLVGFSGGVDSTVCALRLKENGYNVIGYFFDVLGNNEKEISVAKEVAKSLDIELIVESVKDEFEEIVVSNFITEYMSGRTPNPCIICNPNIKFKKLIEAADKFGCEYIATGHYAKVKEIHNKFNIYKANSNKDQSYMLYRLPESFLRRLILPLGDFNSKDDIRDIARKNGFKNADKPDSQEICFIENNGSYIEYIESKGYHTNKGNFVDKEGKVIGKHNGILNYTIGQRKGLGNTFGKPMFVLDIDKDKNLVVLGDNSDLFTNTVISKDNYFTNNDMDFYNGKTLNCKVRYTMKEAPALIEIKGDTIISHFIDPQRAVTKGQSIVFYDNDKLVGGGFIY